MTAETTTPGLSRRSLFRAAGVVAAAAGVAGAGGASAAGLLPGAQTTAAAVEPLKLARVWAGRQLLPGFDDTHVVYADGSAQYLLWPGDLAKLDALGHRYVVEVDDVAAHDAALASAPGAQTSLVATQPGETTTGDYRQYEDFKADMDALAAKYPGFARVFALPHRTLQGRTVYGMEIAKDVDRQDGRPVFYQDG
ncbi:MAG: Carboxypeptidase precursor, partial [Frankiales bacterium]|nr:Carboxypeptidase precursor [Frankiales bacterium]